MKPKARLKITLRCNKNCSYCINNVPEYKKRWVEIVSVDQVDWNNYRTIIVSGGEPLLHDNLVEILKKLRHITHVSIPIYLQTNGTLLTKELVKSIDDYIDGIGYSVHNPNEFMHLKSRVTDIARIKPIRLYVNNITYMSDSSGFSNLDFPRFYFDLKLWNEGESDETEHIYLLK